MRIPALLVVGVCLVGVAPAQSPRELSALLPAKTILVVDLYDAAATADAALKLLDPLPGGLPAPAREALQRLPSITRAATGHDLRQVLRAFGPGQVTFALYPGLPPFPVLLARVEAPEEVRRIYRRMGEKAPPYDLSDGVLTVSDTAAHLRKVLKFRSRDQATLLGNEKYQARRSALLPGRSVRFYLDLKAARFATRLGRVWNRSPDAAKVLFGPIIAAFDRGTRVDGTLEVGTDALRLRTTLDAAAGQSAAAALQARAGTTRSMPAEPADTVAVVSLDRDLGAVLRQPERWLGEDGQLGVANFLSFADLLLGGASFMRDLVPNIEVPLHLFVTANTPDEDAQQPRIKLPAFTLVFGLEADAARRVRSILERALTMVAAVSNPGRLRQKKAPVAVRGGRRDGYKYKFVEFGEFDGPGDPPTEHGLTPTLLFAHGHGILASTVDGAVRMARALKSGDRVQVEGDLAVVRGAALAGLIRDNLGVLVMDRVLKEGESRAQAAAFMRGLAAVAAALELSGQVRSGTAQTTELDLSLRRLRR